MKMLSVLFITILILASPGRLLARPMKLIIDPGHGGKDKGAVKNNVIESKLALSISLQLLKILQKDPRFSVSLTRKTDKPLSLTDRTKIAHQRSADAFISIHANSANDSRVNGGEIYFQNHLPPLEESMLLAHRESESLNTKHAQLTNRTKKKGATELASIIQDLNQNYYIMSSSELAKALLKNWAGQKRSKSHSIHQAPFFVLGNVPMPSVLIEVGFISNLKESRRLSKASYQKRIARGIYRGLKEFKEFVDKQPHSILTSSHEN